MNEPIVRNIFCMGSYGSDGGSQCIRYGYIGLDFPDIVACFADCRMLFQIEKQAFPPVTFFRTHEPPRLANESISRQIGSGHFPQFVFCREDHIDFPLFASLFQSFDQVQQTSFRTAVRTFPVRKEENLHVRFHFIFRVRR